MSNSILKLTSTIFMALVFLISCSTDSKNLADDRVYMLDRSEFSIEHGEKFISNKFFFTKLIGKDSLLYFEANELTFYLFDLENLVVKEFLNFEPDGPNFIENQILDFKKIGQHYAILSANYISIVNQEGETLKRKRINQFRNNMDGSSIAKIHQLEVRNTEELLFAQTPMAALFPIKDGNAKLPIFGIYNYVKDTVSYLPIFLPEETLIDDETQGYYGSDAEHHFLLIKNSIILNFKFSPSIYRYNLNNNQLTHFEGKSIRFQNAAAPFPANRYNDPKYLVRNTMLSGTHFSNIAYDSDNDIYIRFASKKTYERESNKSKNETYIQLFNTDFENIHEELLVIPGKAEVYLQDSTLHMIGVGNYQKEENKTKFIKYKIVESR